jgi:ribonucleoside-triphosphate reductase
MGLPSMKKVTYLQPGQKKCPVCGSTNICRISRITGYLSFDERFGEAKIKERSNRVDHNNKHITNYVK